VSIWVRTVALATSITASVPLAEKLRSVALATYTVAPSGETATPAGLWPPVAIVVCTLLAATSITERVPSPWLVT
jgi:hypothetical protein